jgi:endonuclease YncB( thermonuclease family)
MTSWSLSAARPFSAFALVLLLAGPAGAATVLSVGDGDTIRVSDGNKRATIRLACIDAPETAQTPYGMASRQQLQALAPVGAVVSIQTKTTDRYGRTVAEIFRNGRSVNQAMVSTGEAFVYWQYISGCDRNTYARLEQQAKSQRLGVWAVPGGIERPWDFRRGRRARRLQPTVTTPPSPTADPSGARLTCKQIGSYARAQELLRQGYGYLDGDGDGEACESLR